MIDSVEASVENEDIEVCIDKDDNIPNKANMIIARWEHLLNMNMPTSTLCTDQRGSSC